jgi:hypothetical protein
MTAISKPIPNKPSALPWLVLLLTPIGIFGTRALPLQDTGTISNTTFGSVLITPANYVFIVWALIYGGLMALAVAQVLNVNRDNPRYAAARVPLLVNVAFNFAWLVAWGTMNTPLSLLLIVGQALSALWIFKLLEADRAQLSPRLEGFVQFASGAYVAWLTLATVLNVASVLVFYRWDGWGLSNGTWTAIMMPVAALIGVLEMRAWRNPAFATVFAWAFAGIALRPAQPLEVIVVAGVLTLGFAVALAVSLVNLARGQAVARSS